VEGMVAKRADSTYVSGRRSRDWLKIKAPATAELAIVGFLPGKGRRAVLGALMLAWRRDDELVYAGTVGSGLHGGLIDQPLHAPPACARRTAPTPGLHPGRPARPERGVGRGAGGGRGAFHRHHGARRAAPAGVRAIARRQTRRRVRPAAHGERCPFSVVRCP